MNDNYNFMDELFVLESLTNINIFKKKTSIDILPMLKIRDSGKIIDECNKMKKKKLLLLSSELKKMSGGAIIVDKIKNVHETTLTDINNINKIIDIINYNISKNEFLEIYSN